MVEREEVDAVGRLIEAGDIAWAAGKPLIVCKQGVGETGARVALSHSGALTGAVQAWEAAFARAEEIFQLGQMIPHEVQEAATQRVQRLAVGLCDGLSKLAAHALLAPVLNTVWFEPKALAFTL